MLECVPVEAPKTFFSAPEFFDLNTAYSNPSTPIFVRDWTRLNGNLSQFLCWTRTYFFRRTRALSTRSFLLCLMVTYSKRWRQLKKQQPRWQLPEQLNFYVLNTCQQRPSVPVPCACTRAWILLNGNLSQNLCLTAIFCFFAVLTFSRCLTIFLHIWHISAMIYETNYFLIFCP
jgi:hypothetical protein